MNRFITTLLAFLVFLTHSAWAMDLDFVVGHHSSSNLVISSQEDISTIDIDIKNCNNDCVDHCSHSLAHSMGLLSTFHIVSYYTCQSINTDILSINYYHSQNPPYKPPRV